MMKVSRVDFYKVEMRGTSNVVTASEAKIWSNPLINIGKPTVQMIESTTYKFAKCLQRRFGIIPDITDHGYITNSYHVNVREEIDAFEKLAFESEFQHLSPGGAISYVEVPNMQDNLDAVITVMRFIYDHIIYAELNTKSDLCEICGYDGEIKTVVDDGKLVWECPNCGNRDQAKMSVVRRTCGYLGSQFWNQGRTEEIRDRVMHL